MAPTSAPLVRFFLYATAPRTAPPAAPSRMPLSLPVNGRLSGPKPRSEMQPVSAMLMAMLAARCFFMLPPLRCCPLQSPLSPDLARHFHDALELSPRIVVRE